MTLLVTAFLKTIFQSIVGPELCSNLCGNHRKPNWTGFDRSKGHLHNPVLRHATWCCVTQHLVALRSIRSRDFSKSVFKRTLAFRSSFLHFFWYFLLYFLWFFFVYTLGSSPSGAPFAHSIVQTHQPSNLLRLYSVYFHFVWYICNIGLSLYFLHEYYMFCFACM